MRKKKKLDFIIKQSNYSRLIFRFYPRRSSCHSFTENPPKSWNEVYKVYYSYAILEQSRDTVEDEWESRIVFEEICDECSIIDEVGRRCKLLADGIEIFEGIDGKNFDLLDNDMFPFGMGTSWKISKVEHHDFERNIHVHYEFVLFDYFNVGYEFTLTEEQLYSFGQFLLDCSEYMLRHGEGI